MNAQTGEIYRMPEEIRAAEERHEPLLDGSLEEIQPHQPVLLMNRAARRREARLRAREGRRR